MGNKIVVLGDYEKVFSSSEKAGELTAGGMEIVYQHDIVDESKTVELLADAHIAVLMRERTKIPKEVLEKLPKLKMISQTGSGLAHIDVEQAKKQGIHIATTGGTSTPSVVELTFGLMIACSRGFIKHHENFKNNMWIQTPGFELRGKRLGLLGFGHVAKEVAKVAQCFGMEVVTWRPTGEKGDEFSRYNVKVLNLEELLTTSDIVSAHVRLVPTLKSLLDKERLKMLKKNCIIINTARGALIDNRELVRLLKEGHLRGAGIDTFEQEPLTENIFKDCPNVVLTPHIGYITNEVLLRFADEAFENIKNWLIKNPLS